MLILEKLLEFDGEIKLHIEGGTPQYSFKNDWHKVAMTFRGVLEESRPDIVTLAEINGNVNSHPETPSKRQKHQALSTGTDNPESPSKRQKQQHQATIVLDSDSEEVSFSSTLS